MYTHRILLLMPLAALSAVVCAQDKIGLGQPVAEADVRAWDIDVRADGRGLPPGGGNVQSGAKIYREKCAACHGDRGQGKPMDQLVGAEGTLAGAAPIKTIGSYWPYATTLYDYIYRAMPFTNPQSLTPDEVYALCAYLLYLNGIVDAAAVMNAHTLPAVEMPNRRGFVPDPRPDVANAPCRHDCAQMPASQKQ